jgi:hypothetical protein
MPCVILWDGGHKTILNGSVSETEHQLRDGRNYLKSSSVGDRPDHFIYLQDELYGSNGIAVDPFKVVAVVSSS